MIVEYHPAIQRELLELREYYDRVAGLGQDFLDEFARQVASISAAPTAWMVVRSDVRRSLMKRFPYVILFRQLAANRIRVTVVKHKRRHPQFGLDRI